MPTPYTYTVTQADLASGSMTLRYESPGFDPMEVGARLPLVGQSLDEVARQYAPTAWWEESSAQRDLPAIGATGAVTVPTEPALTLARARTRKLAEIADWRYAREVQGIRVDGATIKTDRESQATIAGALISLAQGLVTSIDWKADGGRWIRLEMPEVTKIAAAVASHVQLSFSLERNYADQVAMAQTIDAVQAIVPEQVFAL